MQFWSSVKLLECSILVQIRSKTPDQNCICPIQHVILNSFNDFSGPKIGFLHRTYSISKIKKACWKAGSWISVANQNGYSNKPTHRSIRQIFM